MATDCTASLAEEPVPQADLLASTLVRMGIRVRRRTRVFTFLGGEVTESLPVGPYFRNYLLHRSTGTDFGLSSAATTLSMVTEVAVCLAGLLILGLGAWSGW